MSLNHATYRTATIRNPDGTVYGNARYRFIKKDNHCTQAGIWIDDATGANVVKDIYPLRDHREGVAIADGNAPHWLTSPSAEALHRLASLPNGGHSDEPNLIAYAIHRRDGALVTRLDFDASGPYGLRFNLYTVPVLLNPVAFTGGQGVNAYGAHRNQTALEGLNNLLGTKLAGYQIQHVTDVYDPDNCRFIHVYQPVHSTLEYLLDERAYGIGKHALNGSGIHAIYDAFRSIVNDMTALRTSDLTAELAEKLDPAYHFTPQLRYLAAAVPNLLPQSKQAAA